MDTRSKKNEITTSPFRILISMEFLSFSFIKNLLIAIGIRLAMINEIIKNNRMDMVIKVDDLTINSKPNKKKINLQFYLNNPYFCTSKKLKYTILYYYGRN